MATGKELNISAYSQALAGHRFHCLTGKNIAQRRGGQSRQVDLSILPRVAQGQGIAIKARPRP